MSEFDRLMEQAHEAAYTAVIEVRDNYARVSDDADSWDVSDAALDAALPFVEKALRAKIAREVDDRLPDILRSQMNDPYGWLSDAQDARLYEGATGIQFHGEGSIDLAHATALAADIVEGLI